MPDAARDLFLVFDAGTQAVRCALIDTAGAVIDLVKRPIQPYFSERKGWAEQHPEYYWDNLCQASRQLLQQNRDRLGQIKTIALTSHRGTDINLDRGGGPLRPAITWLDQRTSPQTRWAPFYLEAGMRAVGLYAPVDSLQRHCPSNWIRHYQPEIWEKTAKCVLLSAYLNYRLVGRLAESLCGPDGSRRTSGPAPARSRPGLRPSAALSRTTTASGRRTIMDAPFPARQPEGQARMRGTDGDRVCLSGSFSTG